MGRSVSVSVVFTDLVGSTELASRLGPDESEQLRQAHFGLLRGALARAGGTEVKNLGDGLMVVFPSVTAAVEGAVAMQQAIGHRNRRARDRLEVRIGIATGDAVEEEDEKEPDRKDYFGEPVVEAARLCALAGGGEILATDVVATLARHSGHRFVPVGDLELKGLPAPVPAVRVEWALRRGGSSVPLPSRLESIVRGQGEFVGRDEELALLGDALDAVLAGEPRTVVVSGEPGVGKTAVVAEFARAAHEDGLTVLYGRCDEELAVPYQPWVEAVGHLVEHVGDTLLGEHVEEHGMLLGRLVPQLADRWHGEASAATDPETERYLMYQAVCAFLDAAGAESPIVVVLDDLHWSDAPSLALLRHMIAAPMANPPLLLGTYRDTDVGRGHPLVDTLATLRRLPGLIRMELEGLSEEAVAALIEGREGQQLTGEGRAFARELRRETSGNPFFTREILRNLAELGDLSRDELGEWGRGGLLEPAQLPESVLEVVRQRVDRLGEDVHRTLTAASIIGRDFELVLLARVLGESEDAVLDRLELAQQAAIVEEVGGKEDRFTFVHALAQHTMQADLSSARRRRLHRRVAEAIEELWPDEPGDRAGEVARHWLAAVAPVDAERAVRSVCRAGDRALDALAPDEALRWYREALELLDDAPDPDRGLRCRILVSMGTAQKQVGDPAYRETLLEAASLAQQVGDTESLVEAALTNNRGYHSNSGVTDHERVAALEAALEAVGEEDSTERALLLATLCAESNFHQSQEVLQQLAQESLDMARRLGDPRTTSEVLSRTRVAVHFLETIEERFPLYVESRRLADEVGDPVVVFHAAQALLWVGAVRADMATFDEQLETMVAVSERVGQPILQWLTRYTEAMRAAIAGDLDRSEQLADEALKIGGDSGQPDAVTFWGGQVMRVRQMQGRLPELLEFITDLAAVNSEFPVFRAVHTVAASHAGDGATARKLLEEERERGFDGPHEMQWGTAMTLWAEAIVRLGHHDAAAELYPLLVPFERFTAFTGLTYGGPLSYPAGQLAVLLGRLDEGDAHLARSLGVAEQTHDPYLLAGTRLTMGRSQLARARRDGDESLVERAVEAGDAALDLARTHGFGGIEADARELLGSARR